jgi:PelA/Pel-15E family pectate lyase
VGAAILRAYERTGEAAFLEAARQAGVCLVRGQLESGGWTYRIEFDPQARRRFFYRVPPTNQRGFNVSTLDDDTTQSALQFLMQLDRALEFKDRSVHEAVQYGLDRLLKVQYPCGAWPQGFHEPPDPAAYPVLKASYPEEVPPAPDFKEYWRFYTLNDFAHMDTIRTMLLAADIYGEEKYKRAAERGGEFLILAQMPDPQPAWAQQYNFAMQPAWARKFEPPAITGHESQEVLRVLCLLCERTGRPEFLDPIPRAIAYLKRSVLPDGRLARFYELKTNRPLYFTRDYRLTYDDSNLPRHYGFKVDNDLDRIERQYEDLQRMGPRSARGEITRGGSPSRIDPAAVERVIRSLDEKGRWVEKGSLSSAAESVNQVIRTQTFIRNVDILSGYLAQTLP